MNIRVKDGKYYLDGEERFIISGEFHYFRVPADDWERRLILFREMYGNCIATYVPWSVHETEEGHICFGDEPQRDLAAFLELCKKHDMPVILRPGPYCYSELNGGGVPVWLTDRYPETRAARINGDRTNSVSYMHPLFLEKARRYYRAFADTVRPYLASNGGPVCMVQVDNELTGTHIWGGTIDYNPDTCGFGRPDGRYASFLTARYGSLDRINAAYGTSWKDLSEAFPLRYDPQSVYSCRCGKDMFDFYLDLCGEYLGTLAGWLREDGIDSPLCHNSGNENMTGYFEKILPHLDRFGGMLLGSDHYYNLGQGFEQNNPTPHYALNMLRSYDQLHHLGMAPMAMELPGGSCSSFPPILSEDLLACYMVNTAMGMKALNYYIFTGGPNYGETGGTADIYDYDALVHADGSINKTYYAAQKFGHFLDTHRWLQSAERLTSVRVACEQEYYRCKLYEYRSSVPQEETRSFMKKGILYGLMTSEFTPELADTAHCVPDTDKPLILCGSDVLSEASQKNIVSFLEAGGKLLAMQTLPTLNEDLMPCTVLRDYIGITMEPFASPKPATCSFMKERVYCLSYKNAVVPEKDRDTVVAVSDRPVAVLRKTGKGEVLFAGLGFELSQYSQAEMLHGFVKMLGAEAAVYHSNPHIFSVLLKHPDGRGTVFAMNLYSSAQNTDIETEGRVWKDLELAPMEVRALDI